SRSDLAGRPTITALFKNVVDTSLATVIGNHGAIVSTIEHVMAAFAGLGIDNALVESDSYELPIMDGSAGPFTELLVQAGSRAQEAPRTYFRIHKPIRLESGDRWVELTPDDRFTITCTIAFSHPAILEQSFSLPVEAEYFAREIAPARTFGFLHEVDFMRMFGLAKGGSLDNAVVVDHEKVLNEDGLRFPDEFVRHKTLDCLGDFSLLGIPILGHIRTYKSGHAFNHAFLETFFARKDHWETVTFP
ncbi:MAG: UDP-3-O-acyl-N-acetylglucosamine deacetylase, partial [Pseudomonadota bacterium]